MARPDLWSLLCKREIVSRGRSVWLTVLSLHSSPVTHWESMDLFWLRWHWGKGMTALHQYALPHCVVLYVCVHILLLCHVAVYLQVHPIWRHLLLTNLLLGSTAGCAANKSSSHPSCPTRSFLPWILLFMTQSFTVNALLHHWSYVRGGWTRHKLAWCELRSCQKASLHLDSHRWKRLVTLHMHVRGANGAVKALITPVKDNKISTRNTSNSVFFIYIVFICIQQTDECIK